MICVQIVACSVGQCLVLVPAEPGACTGYTLPRYYDYIDSHWWAMSVDNGLALTAAILGLWSVAWVFRALLRMAKSSPDEE